MSAEKKLYLCMGSACYHHGAAKVLKVIENKLRENGMHTQIELMGHFCLGTCDRAVVMAYGEQRFENLTPENAGEIFDREIMPCLQSAPSGGVTGKPFFFSKVCEK